MWWFDSVWPALVLLCVFAVLLWTLRYVTAARLSWPQWAARNARLPLAVRRAIGKSAALLVRPAQLLRHYNASLSAPAKELVDRCLALADGQQVFDVHCHVFGTGCCGSQCMVPPEEERDVKSMTVTNVLLRASGCRSEETADTDFVEMLSRIAIGNHVILSFDKFYNLDGSVNLEKTHVHTPDSWIERVCEMHPQLFIPSVSIHPYRKDALETLEKASKRGVKIIKWLPNSMGIDPLVGCDEFFRTVAKLDMVILSHGGEERAVEADPQLQEYGNPLRMIRALELGCKVIIAHCASLGTAEDLQSSENPKPQVLCFDLFCRMMEDPSWEGLLFGDISAITLVNRMRYCSTLLTKKWAHRLLYGSDWPLPGLRVLNFTLPFQRAGLITKAERLALNEIYDVNPLLYDVCLKRCMRGANGERFPDSIFVRNKAIFG